MTHPHHYKRPDGSPVLRVTDMRKAYGAIQAVGGISFEVRPGEIFGVIGPNGSGKTTLCRAVLGLMAPLTGHLRIFDCACGELRCHHRAQIGYLPQKGVVDRNFPVTVLETVMMGRYGTLGLFKRTTKKDQAIALDALAHVGRHEFHEPGLTRTEAVLAVPQRVVGVEADHVERLR